VTELRHVTWRQPGSGRRWWQRSGWRGVAVAAIVVAVAVAAAALVGPARGGPVAAPGTGEQKAPVFPASSLARKHGVLFGASVQAVAYSGPGTEQAAFAAFERTIGRKLAINSLYVPWTGPMPLAAARWDLARGTIPLITWAMARAGRIDAGADDSTIRAAALALRALRKPVLLRWFAEMDVGLNRAYAGSPGTFVTAWRRIHRIFQRAGATNVRWVWCPNASGFAHQTASAYYPGKSYVDWICTDGFNWASRLVDASWASFRQIFLPFYQWGRSTGKPMLIGEFGSVEGRPGAKAAWFSQADRAIRTQFPAIRAVVYFESEHQNFGRLFDWRVTTSRSALRAFRAFAHDRYFSAGPPAWAVRSAHHVRKPR
jgi:Glycosyl hydrolase family 26